MRIKKLLLEDFLAWKGSHEFDLTNNNLVYLTGPNGAGKSSIYDAVCWAWFGRVTKLEMKADEVINKDSKSCSVSLEFVVKKDQYVVTRYRKHPKLKNSIVVTKNGKELSQKREIQKVLESIIGFDYDNFVQTILFSQSDHRYFTQLGETDQRAVLGRVFGFGIFRQAVMRVREHSRVLLREIMEVEGGCNLHRGLIQEVKVSITSLKKKKASLKSVDTSEVSKAQINLHLIKRELLEIEEKLSKTTHLKEAMEDEQEESETSLKRLASIQKLILLYKSDVKCDSCGQPLPPDKANELLEKYTNEKKELIARLKTLEEKELFAKIEKLKIEQNSLTQKRSKLRIDQSNCLAIIKAADMQVQDIKKDLLKQKEKLKLYRSKLSKLKDDLNKLREEAKCCDFWENGYGSKGIETFALEKALPMFNATVNKYLSKIPTNKGVIAVDYSMVNGHLVPRIRFLGSNLYSGVSGGEKRRIDIAVSLALYRLYGIHSNLIMLDEPFEGIESSAYASVVKMLRDFMKENKIETIFVSAHNNDLKAHFQSVWNIGMNSKGHAKLTSKTVGGSEIL